MTALLKPTPAEAALADAFASVGEDEARQSAWDAFVRTGLPHRRMEAWRWSDVRAAVRALGAAAERTDVPPARLFADVNAHRLTFADGWLAEEIDDADGLDVRGAGATFPGAGGGPAADLARALAPCPLHIAVAPGAHIERPILVRRVAALSGGHAHERLRVTLGEGARATLIEIYEGEGDGLANGLTEIELADAAVLTRVIAQADGADLVRVATAMATLADGAHFEQAVLAFGAKLARIETHVTFAGEGASATLDGAYLLDGARHADLTSHVEHAAPRCETRQLVKGAVRDTATGVFQGKFHVARGAQKTDARMGHHALTLSEGATVNAKPELEIYADDVECAHGNTAGALDADQLFYMQARGLAEADAKALLTEAFVAEAFDRVEDAAVRETLRAEMRAWLGRRA